MHSPEGTVDARPRPHCASFSIGLGHSPQHTHTHGSTSRPRTRAWQNVCCTTPRATRLRSRPQIQTYSIAFSRACSHKSLRDSLVLTQAACRIQSAAQPPGHPASWTMLHPVCRRKGIAQSPRARYGCSSPSSTPSACTCSAATWPGLSSHLPSTAVGSTRTALRQMYAEAIARMEAATSAATSGGSADAVVAGCASRTAEEGWRRA